MAKLKWIDRCQPCKIGTVPMVVYVHAADRRRLKPGFWARIREAENGPWAKVLATRVDEGGYFMADR